MQDDDFDWVAAMDTQLAEYSQPGTDDAPPPTYRLTWTYHAAKRYTERFPGLVPPIEIQPREDRAKPFDCARRLVVDICGLPIRFVVVQHSEEWSVITCYLDPLAGVTDLILKSMGES